MFLRLGRLVDSAAGTGNIAGAQNDDAADIAVEPSKDRAVVVRTVVEQEQRQPVVVAAMLTVGTVFALALQRERRCC